MLIGKSARRLIDSNGRKGKSSVAAMKRAKKKRNNIRKKGKK